MSSALRVLITAYDLASRRGVPMVTRDLAIGLAAAGHEPTLYTQQAGEIAEELRQLGFRVEERAGALEGPFDVIHGNHLVVCAEVLARLPETPAVFVCHDNEAYFDAAPVLPNV